MVVCVFMCDVFVRWLYVVCVSMSVWLCGCVIVCVYGCLYLCVGVWMSVCVCLCKCLCVYVYGFGCACT